MGLGKTIVVISLVCTSLPTARTWASQPMIPDKLDNRLEETLTPADFSSAGRAVSTSDFASHVWGLGAGGSASIADAVSDGSGKKMSKKNQKKQKKEMKKDEEVMRRFGKLECRSRATLIVCPLSTVQNWEAQFEEHARGSADENGVGGEKAFELGGGGAGGTGAGKKDRKGKKRAVVADSEEEEDAGDRDSIVSASSSDSEDAGMKKKDKKPKPGVSIYIYHGNSRISDPKKLANFDIVITTFSSLVSFVRRSAMCRMMS
jgi:SWI/SNF-related matrix-associated actin-dependent regulator of chromatin subfamily A3